MDDPFDLIKGNSIAFLNVSDNSLALRISEVADVEAVYFDQYGIERDYKLSWQSEDETIAVVNNGKVEGKASGTTTIVVSYLDVSKALQITVVNNVSSVATVIIANPVNTTLNLNDEVQLTASVRNIEDE
ncbi:MAG: hypothetical protein EBU52_19465, partial [Cytophagia bacterium]|nr:hypothetical protein [Cytophagia bacterium]